MHQFTAAVERALVYASGWSCRTDCGELEAEPLLVGLLSEPECRAARMLAGMSVDIPAVRQRWPGLAEDSTPSHEGPPKKPFSREVEFSLQLARQRLAAFPQPLELATEHILLGLAAADHEVAQWLRQRGLDPKQLEATIHGLYGHPWECSGNGELEPVDIDWGASDVGREAGDEQPKPNDAIGCDASTLLQSVLAVDCLAADSTSATSEPIRPTYRWPLNPQFRPQQGIGAGCANVTPPRETTTLRVFDAAGNRAREGLRVVEDYVRFALDDRHLTELCKQLRHDLTDSLGRVSPEHRLAARETQADVGTVLTTASEQSRTDLAGVLAANFARLQESLRSLEEYGKMVDAELASVFKQLRYRTYTLQRAVHTTGHGSERLAEARLYVLIDGGPSVDQFERLAHDLIGAGVDMIQLRDKRLADRELFERARLLRTWTEGTNTLLVINDRPDLAALVRADGVHVGQEELSVKDVRSVVGPEMLVGVSTHGIEQARRAVLDGASYIGVGPTFPSDTKQFERFPGVELLRGVAAEIRLPAFAIGGIGVENIEEVLAAGFTRIAVGRAVTGAGDPARAAEALLERVTHPASATTAEG